MKWVAISSDDFELDLAAASPFGRIDQVAVVFDADNEEAASKMLLEPVGGDTYTISGLIGEYRAMSLVEAVAEVSQRRLAQRRRNTSRRRGFGR